MEIHNFNMNASAEVILTKTGADVLNKFNKRYLQYDASHLLNIKTYKEDDVYSSPLWEIMQIFGPEIYMGCDVPFKDNNIKITNE